MAAILMTIGDYRQFQLAVTKLGQPVDLTGVQELTFTLQRTGGVVLAQWPLGGGVVVSSPPTAGLAVLTVTPAMLAWATADQTLRYSWSLIDSLGNPTLNLENGTLQLVLPP
jgi:hypothetical protein